MFVLILTKFKENLSTGFALIYQTQTPLSHVIYFLGDFGHVLFIRSCHENVILALMTFPELHKFGAIPIVWTSVYLGLG